MPRPVFVMLAPKIGEGKRAHTRNPAVVPGHPARWPSRRMLRLHLRSRAHRDAIGAGEYACAFSQRHDHDRAASLAHHAADRCARAIDA